MRGEHGSVAVERVRAGDRVWAKDEFDPTAPPVLCVVEELFVRHAPVLRVHVGGRVIVTTGEHPFWVRGTGWVEAFALAPGDVLVGMDGQPVPVEAVEDAGEWATVYNVRVADCHTYFVGCDEWGFDLWCHNARYRYPEQKEARRAAVEEAWRQEAEMVRRTGMGTRPWTDAQKRELLANGFVRRYVGHHINSVGGSPLLAGVADNIEFMTYRQHFLRHLRNWRNQTRGQLLDRSV